MRDDTNNNNNLNKNVINSGSFKYKTSITEALIMLMQELPMKKVMQLIILIMMQTDLVQKRLKLLFIIEKSEETTFAFLQNSVL